MMEAGHKILRQHRLRNTVTRINMLQMFIRKGIALSEPQIEQELNESCDRVTIYRNLSTFMEKGIVHKVLDDSGVMKYALCSLDCRADQLHYHDHVHFKCTQCGSTRCLEEIQISLPSLPAGFELEEANILLKGRCPKCMAD